MKRFLSTLCITGLLILSIAGGCAKESDLGLPNTPPETFISVADSVRNPGIYIQQLHWWGDDIDGEVVGYEYRWFMDPAEPGCPMDTDWVFTEETWHEFHIPVSNGVIRRHRVEVRAVDNRQAVDPTPSTLSLPVTNTPPVVSLRDANSLPDTTYPAALFKWEAEDAEGRETVDVFKVWLDGNEENARIVQGDDSTAAFGYDDFQGRYGERTVYLFAIDTGCDSSNVVSYTWHVKEPVGNVLIIDDLWSSAGAVDFTTNLKYMSLMNACVGEFSKLDLEGFDGVTYAHNYPDLFEIFDLVIWYDEPVRAVSSTLHHAKEAVKGYAGGGGSFMLVSLTALGPTGSFYSEDMFEVFGIDSLYWRPDPTGYPLYNFDCKKSWHMQGDEGAGLDSLKVLANTLGAKCMAKADTSASLYHIAAGTIDTAQTVDYYLAVLNDYGLGKVAVFTIPLSKCDGYGTLENEFCKVVDLMLD
ncbi:MAG: hypothetical protein PVJ42_09885 [bacterium]|jgi:hypothetical protein